MKKQSSGGIKKKLSMMQSEHDPVYDQMIESSDKKDEVWKKNCDEIIEEENKIKGFKKLWPYQDPIAVLPIALLASFVMGCSHLMTGVAFSKMMPLLGVPMEYVKIMFP